ncbi:MAG: hypothetical protein KC933_15885 [Myxococcales bacterium]|nr:hypothetical protein [Myxococcales bacterium]
MKQTRTRPLVLAAAAALTLAACGRAIPAPPDTAASAEALNLSGTLSGAGGLWGHTRPTLELVEPVQTRLGEAPPRDFVPRHLFCDALAEVLCAPLEQCGCGDVKLACRDDVETDCQGNYGILGPQAMQAIRDDHMGYDGFAAYRVLRQLATGVGDCQTPLAALEWDRQDMLTFGGVFRGYLAPGSACTLPFAPFRGNECRDGVCMLDEFGLGQCAPAVGVGASCVEGAVCFELDAPVSMRTFFEGTFFGVCDASRPDAPVCVRRTADFEPCRADDECVSGWCAAKMCRPKSGAGDACRHDLDCAAGSCQDEVCAAPNLPVGAACARHEDCATDACHAGVCGEPICRR